MFVKYLLLLMLSCQFIFSINVYPKEMVITIDDLPFVGPSKENELTIKLLEPLKGKQVPAIGFVNEKQIDDKPETKHILELWVDLGFELGNHTYSHLGLHETTLPLYQENILKGEKITKELLASKGKTLHYFRHPYLFTGRTLEIKEEMNRFFKEHHYEVAPITVDNSDWIFARAFEEAIHQKDDSLQQKIKEAYIPYLASKIDYFEKQTELLFGRSLPQIMLLHANTLNAHMMPAILKMIEEKKYHFISLETALTDPLYKEMEDRYIGPAGISWLHRYALVQKKEVGVLKGEPRCPPFVMELAHVLSE